MTYNVFSGTLNPTQSINLVGPCRGRKNQFLPTWTSAVPGTKNWVTRATM